MVLAATTAACAPAQSEPVTPAPVPARAGLLPEPAPLSPLATPLSTEALTDWRDLCDHCIGETDVVVGPTSTDSEPPEERSP